MPRQKEAEIQPQKGPDEPIQCCVSEEVKEDEVYYYRHNVCVPESEYPLTEFEGNHYCLFHLPKSTANNIRQTTKPFAEQFEKRLKVIEERIAETETLSEEEIEIREIFNLETRSEMFYDFSYVSFFEIKLDQYKFLATVNFSSATFFGKASFAQVEFMADAQFAGAIFAGPAYFTDARFSGQALFKLANFSTAFFQNATFIGEAIFESVTFSEAAFLGLAEFLAPANFGYAQFSGKTDFTKAEFSDSAYFSHAGFSEFTDFSQAVFSGVTYFESAAFSAHTIFSSVTFSTYAKFTDAAFSGDTWFISTQFVNTPGFTSSTFSDSVYFSSAVFSSSAVFDSARFLGNAEFTSTAFRGDAFFNAVTFSAIANFGSATFFAFIDFSSAIFTDTSQISFKDTSVCSLLKFYETEISGSLDFEGTVFLDKEQVEEFNQEFNIINYDVNKEAFLSFNKASINKPELVSFNKMKLRPCWFVNAEVRNFGFNDIEWSGLEIDIDRGSLNKELDKLKEMKVPHSNEALIKVCHQLADNAQANRRFEEVKHFGKQVIALQNKKCHVHDSIDPLFKREIWVKVCQQYPVVNEHAGNYYCLWHNPDKNKAEILLEEFKKRIKAGHSDFRAVVFPISVEYKVTEPIGNGVFETTIVKLPQNVNFSHATFQKRLIIEKNTVYNLFLQNIVVEKAAELIIKDSICKGKVNFDRADFAGKLFVEGNSRKELFENSDEALSLFDASFDKPEWINFRCLRLRPHYFLGVDASKLIFHDCEWKKSDEDELSIDTELKLSSHKALAEACNKLAINYEENRHYEESSDFRYMAMESKRLNNQSPLGRIFNLYWLYKWTSGYGESRLWATFVLIFLSGLFGVLYSTPLANFDYGTSPRASAKTVVAGFCNNFELRDFDPQGMNVCDGLVHSLSVASFQRPEPKPADFLTKLLVTLETILAPLQAALLALAIRRKFMR